MPAWASAAPRTRSSEHRARRAPQPAGRARVDTRGINHGGAPDVTHPSRRARRPGRARARPRRSRHRRRRHQARRHDPRRVQGDDHHRDAHRQGQPPRGADDLLLPVRHHDGLRLAHAERRRRRRHRGRRGHGTDRRPRAATRSTTTASSPTTASGTTVGGDRAFTTPKQPLGLALAATPNPVAFGAPSTLAGTLSGTGNAGRPIQLQQKPFPFTTAVRQRRQRPAHERPGRLLLRAALGAADHAVPRAGDRQDVGGEPGPDRQRHGRRRHQDDAHARPPRRARALLRHGARRTWPTSRSPSRSSTPRTTG